MSEIVSLGQAAYLEIVIQKHNNFAMICQQQIRHIWYRQAFRHIDKAFHSL